MDTAGAILEITVATVSTLLATVLAVFIVPRALPRLAKVLLLVIALSMILSSSCTVCNVSITSFINSNGTVVPRATILNVRIAQSIGIQSKSIALLLLLLERLLFVVFPTFRQSVILRSVFLSIAIVASIIGIAVLFAVSIISWNLLTVLNKIMIGPELIVLPLCFFGQMASRKLYKSTFAVASLNLRYEVSETIELTRVIFPICAVDSILSIVTIIFGFMMSGKTIDYRTYTPIARWISTIQSLCTTILILTRHRLFIRRIREMLGMKGLDKSRKLQPKHNESDKYFELFHTQW